MIPIFFMWQQTWGFIARCGFPGSGLVRTSQNLQHVQTHICLSKCFESLLRDKVWGRGFEVELPSEEGITANRKRRFFCCCLTLNKWGRVGYHLIRNSSLHLLKAVGWHSWKIKWNYNVCKIVDNVSFASGLAWAVTCSLQLRCHCCV